MEKAKPEISCKDTVLKYKISEDLLKDAKKQILKVAGKVPVMFIENRLPDNQIELVVIAASLTSPQAEKLKKLQEDGVMLQKIAKEATKANFDGRQIRFNMGSKKD